MTTPRISIVTSSYNQGSFIERTIESIRTQDYPDVEHIIVDGMSSDSTMDVLAK
jgi:glycosyltransferase involved in cell wall biosynthesis